MAQIEELLRILTIESNLVQHLTQVRGTQHAGVVISHIKSTRVTRIPVGIPFYHVGVRLLLYLGRYSGSTRIPSRESSWRTTGETACGICTWRTVLWNTEWGAPPWNRPGTPEGALTGCAIGVGKPPWMNPHMFKDPPKGGPPPCRCTRPCL
jgi:hypothetical protein